MKWFARKGSKITCDLCKIEVYEFVTDVKFGDIRDAVQVKGINGFDNPKDGDEYLCPNCGEPGLPL